MTALKAPKELKASWVDHWVIDPQVGRYEEGRTGPVVQCARSRRPWSCWGVDSPYGWADGPS